MPLNTMKKFEKTINLQGGKLAGGFTVRMQHNGLGYKEIPNKKQESMYHDWTRKCSNIALYVHGKKEGTIETSHPFDRIRLCGLLIKVIPKLLPLLQQAVLKGWDSLGLWADVKCNGCGICQTICPVDNISMHDQRPAWSDHCITCFACLHWCPQEAIQVANLTNHMKRYHHPDVSSKDIVTQKVST
jgi:ferredoxin